MKHLAQVAIPLANLSQREVGPRFDSVTDCDFACQHASQVLTVTMPASKSLGHVLPLFDPLGFPLVSDTRLEESGVVGVSLPLVTVDFIECIEQHSQNDHTMLDIDVRSEVVTDKLDAIHFTLHTESQESLTVT